MLYGFLIAVHVFVCVVLILVILLQAGRGGGLAEMWSGGQAQSVFGTQTNTFLTRFTAGCAVVFILTSLSLGILTTQRGKSLVEKERLMRSLKTVLPAVPAPATESTPTPAAGSDKAVTVPAPEKADTQPANAAK